MALHHASHTIYDLNYHLIWSTKYRKYIFSNLMCGWCKKFLSGVAREYDVYLTEVEVMPDHVHILVSAPPRFSPSQLARILKSKSAKAMFQRFPELRKHYWGGELWVDGFCVTSVGQNLGLQDIKKYIREQRQDGLF